MPRFRNISVAGLPSELWGLHNSNFYSTTMFGDTNTGFWDACKIRSPQAQQDGHYLVCGIGTGGVGAQTPRVLVLGGGSPIGYVTPTSISGSLQRFNGCASAPAGAGTTMDTAWFIGPGDPSVVRIDGAQHVLNPTLYLPNGSVSGAAWEPNQTGTARLDVSIGSGKVMAYGMRNDTSRKFMSTKSVGDSSTSTWTQVTVPGDASSYVKARQSNAGFTIAITDGHSLDNSTNSSLTNMITDGSRTSVLDMDYSSSADLFIICDGTNVYTAPAGWGGGGNPTWTLRALPSSAGLPFNVVALDIPSSFAPIQEQQSGTHTWYMIMAASIFGVTLTTCLLTRDFVQYYGVEIPGLIMAGDTSNSMFPVRPYVKFVHDRLFVFNKLGVTVSGKLGNLAERY